MPHTSNGKIGRRALLTLEQTDSGARQVGRSEPQDQIEKAVAAIWREVLRLDQVGMHDNFFDLGGTSLMMTQVLRRVRDQLGNNLSLVDMFRSPTVSTQAVTPRSGRTALKPIFQHGGGPRQTAREARRRGRT